jgi:hypothetical protein
MKQQVRELLVTGKVAQNWEGQFDQKVEELMVLVNKMDTEKRVLDASEVLDVYHKMKQKPVKSRKKKQPDNDKPFEFLVFRN